MRRITLRVKSNLHSSWHKEARKQGLSLNAYITTCIQNDMLKKENSLDPLLLEHYIRLMTDVQKSIKEVDSKLDRVQKIVDNKVYDRVDTDRARDALLNILLDPKNVKEIKALTTRKRLNAFIVERNPLMERYMIATPQDPMTILDEIIFELEAKYYICTRRDGTIDWGQKLWIERDNVKSIFSQK